MRVLQFIVREQNIKKNQKCDFTGIVPNSKGYLKAQFAFDASWEALRKIVAFSAEGEEEEAYFIDEANECEIPSNMLKHHKVYLRVIGTGEGIHIETNKASFKQEGA